MTAPATCKQCGAPLSAGSAECDHGADTTTLPTSAKAPAAPVGGLSVVPAAPAAAGSDSAVQLTSEQHEAAKAEVKAGLMKAGYTAEQAEQMAADAIQNLAAK